MKISIERVLTDEATQALYPTYALAFKPLLTEAAARHMLSAEEFAKEMNDPRIEKYLVRDDHDQAIGLTTLTTDLSVIDWINEHFYASRYPEAVARNALFYLGYTLVDPDHRRSNALLLMASEVNRRVARVSGVVAFDICRHNVTHGVGRLTARIFSSSDRIDTLDTQTYYAADYQHLLQAGADQVPPRSAALGGIGTLRPTTLAERPDLADDISAVLASRWPAYMLAGQAGHTADLEDLLLANPGHQVMLLDDQDQVQGVGLSLPLWWDGTVAGLPSGWDDAIERSVAQLQDGVAPNVSCALSITIPPSAARKRLAVKVVDALKAVARDAGGHTLLAPIRPILKPEFPLVDMESYVGWRTPDGQVFDPWIRLHLREGADLLQVAPESMVISGRLEEWERWVDAPLPGSGEFVIDGGLAPLQVDADAGTAVYREPNVWVAHRLTS